MIRLLVLAITTVMAASATTAGATEMTVKVAGKAVPQVHADIVNAARTVCRADMGSSPTSEELLPYCVRDVTRTAIYKVGSPTLTAYDRANYRSAYAMKVSR